MQTPACSRVPPGSLVFFSPGTPDFGASIRTVTFRSLFFGEANPQETFCKTNFWQALTSARLLGIRSLTASRVRRQIKLWYPGTASIKDWTVLKDSRGSKMSELICARIHPLSHWTQSVKLSLFAVAASVFGGLLCCRGYVGSHHINAGRRHSSGVSASADRNNGYLLYVPYDSNLVI